MNERVLTGFSTATQEVLKLMLDVDTVADVPVTKEDRVYGQDSITVKIGLTGDVSGSAYYNFPKDTALEMVKIMSGMEIEEVDEFVTSAMGELSNIISGNALTSLSQQEISCDILPPEILTGADAEEDTCAETAGKCNTGIHTTAGDMDLAVQTVEN